jgi:hypothetical protein
MIPTLRRPTSLLLGSLLLIVMTQTGCATLITATTCLATRASDCGPAIGAAATVDAIVLDAAAASSTSYSCDELVCYADGQCYCDD